LVSFISVSVAAPTLHDRDAAGQLREPLLELLAVEVESVFSISDFICLMRP
jgi:hypothetical protein